MCLIQGKSRLVGIRVQGELSSHDVADLECLAM